MDREKTYSQSVYDDEITLKELILKIKELWGELMRNWILISLIALPFLGYFLFKHFMAPVEYNAEVRFVIEGNSKGGGGIGALSGLLGTFGMGGSSVNQSKVLELGKSKRTAAEVLFRGNNPRDYLANRIIEAYDLNNKWEHDDYDYKSFSFTKDSVDIFPQQDRIAYLRILGKLLGSKKDRSEALLLVNVDDDSGVFTINANSVDESMSLDIGNFTFESIKYFFEEEALKSQTQARDLLGAKIDSFSIGLTARQYELANFEESNRGLVSLRRRVRKERVKQEIIAISSALIETSKSYEMADFSVKNQKPTFLLIDEPYPPLSPTPNSLFKSILLGILLGGFIGSGFVILRKIYRDAMAE